MWTLSTVAKAITGTAVVLMLCAAGVALNAQQSPKAKINTAQPRSAKPSDQEVLVQWAQANSICRDGPYSLEEGPCATRTRLDNELEVRGYCFGQGATAGYQQSWAKCMTADEVAAASARFEEEAATSEQEYAFRQYEAHSVVVTSFMKAPIGWLQKDFDVTIAYDGCWTVEGVTQCHIAHPDPRLCPSRTPCTDLTFDFESGRLTGLGFGLDKENWDVLRSRAETLPGAPIIQQGAVGPMTITSVSWPANELYLSFLQYSGTDIRGGPIAAPFRVGLRNHLP